LDDKLVSRLSEGLYIFYIHTLTVHSLSTWVLEIKQTMSSMYVAYLICMTCPVFYF